MDGLGPSPLERFVEVRGAIDWRNADVGDSSFVLYDVDGLAEAQIGYAVGVGVGVGVDDDLTGDAPGQWQPLWLVVGEEEYGLNTLLVDLDDPRLLVLGAEEELLARALARTPASGHAAWRAWLDA